MSMRTAGRTIVGSVCATLLSIALLQSPSYARMPQEIDTSVNVALDRFTQQVSGADAFLRDAKGVLVFPDVLQAGIGSEDSTVREDCASAGSLSRTTASPRHR